MAQGMSVKGPSVLFGSVGLPRTRAVRGDPTDRWHLRIGDRGKNGSCVNRHFVEALPSTDRCGPCRGARRGVAPNLSDGSPRVRGPAAGEPVVLSAEAAEERIIGWTIRGTAR